MSARHRKAIGVDLIWEIPLAVVSFCFFKGMKCVIGQLYNLYLVFNPEQKRNWRILSAETLAMRLSLPVLMTKGPRWNTHAIIGTVGPFPVQSSLAIQVESATQSAQAWTIAVYRAPAYRTVTQLGSIDINAEQSWATLSLPPGHYSLGVRYYHYSEPIQFPTLKIDGHTVISTKTAPANANAVYQTLAHRKNGFYLALHYYVWTLLRLQHWLPAAFVQREYLPVGDPKTTFLYDYFRKDNALQVSCDPRLLENYWVYFTAYNRASLPVHSCQIKEKTSTLPRMSHDGFYLVRLRPQSSALQWQPDWIQVTIGAQ